MDPFTALADPSRRRIIEILAEEARPAGAIAAAFDFTSAAASQHLKALREAGLVRVRIDGPRRIYSLDPEGLAAVEAWIARTRGFWSERLDALERALAAEEE
jgi:DNA-binding transcriptional ArsR family regulator